AARSLGCPPPRQAVAGAELPGRSQHPAKDRRRPSPVAKRRGDGDRAGADGADAAPGRARGPAGAGGAGQLARGAAAGALRRRPGRGGGARGRAAGAAGARLGGPLAAEGDRQHPLQHHHAHHLRAAGAAAAAGRDRGDDPARGGGPHPGAAGGEDLRCAGRGRSLRRPGGARAEREPRGLSPGARRDVDGHPHRAAEPAAADGGRRGRAAGSHPCRIRPAAQAVPAHPPRRVRPFSRAGAGAAGRHGDGPDGAPGVVRPRALHRPGPRAALGRARVEVSARRRFRL
ncbi:MAG: SSU rRNA (adenine(1518)-N(6)/adenine(1519)-N(6))-dimethyltransferase, partial [uncultured Gemmatimonadetes bacterium]